MTQLDPYDYVRIQAQLNFQCQRCGTCCMQADPIDLYPKDIRRLASYLNISIETVIQEYTIPHPNEPDLKALKGSSPCIFYDQNRRECKIYLARPMVCRCCPFLSPDQIGHPSITVYEDCPACEEGLKWIESNLDLLLNPDAKARKRLEMALSKLMQIE
jgi:Fe-S-cluster containining protein